MNSNNTVYSNSAVVGLILIMATADFASAQGDVDSTRARALMEGAALARASIDSIVVEVDISGHPAHIVRSKTLLIEKQVDRYRVVQTLRDIGERCITIRKGDLFYRFYPSHEHGTVQVFDLETPFKVPYIVDPAVLGLTSILSIHNTLRDSLWLTVDDQYTVISRTPKEGDRVLWQIRKSRTSEADNIVTTDFWVEEPLFRILRKETRWSIGESVIESTYSSDDQVLPDVVEIKRRDSGEEFYKKIELRVISLNEPIDNERFTFKSMEIPLNTPASDARSMRRIGYWNGEEFVPDPISNRELRRMEAQESADEPQGYSWFSLISITAIVLVGAALVAWRMALSRKRG